MTQPAQIAAEIQKLEPSALIELFVLDGTPIGAEKLFFHAGTNNLLQPITWQGQQYAPYPIAVDGFNVTANGQLPRPKLSVSNLSGIVSFLILQYNELLGAIVTRKRTHLKYLDAVNFPGGVNPTADPTAAYVDESYIVDRRAQENADFVQFELASPFDVNGVQLPRRQITPNVCPWVYRGTECGYTGTAYFTAADAPAGDVSQDACGKRLTSCQLRFPGQGLPFGGFPGAGLIKQ